MNWKKPRFSRPISAMEALRIPGASSTEHRSVEFNYEFEKNSWV